MSKESEYQKAWYHKRAKNPEWRAHRAAKARAWRLTNPEKVRARKADYRRRNPEKVKYAEKMRLFKSNYALTRERFEGMFAAQGGRCAICRKPLEKLGRQTHIDHDHATGIVRGILCEWCNHGLGYLERPGYLEGAVAYLERACMLKSGHGGSSDSIRTAGPVRDSPEGDRGEFGPDDPERSDD